MTTLTVWKFDTPTGADQAVDTSGACQAGADQRPRRRHRVVAAGREEAEDPAAAQPDRGRARWAGCSGACCSACSSSCRCSGCHRCRRSARWAGSLTDVGIDDDFIKSVRDKVTPGTSALFLMSSDAVDGQGEGRLRGARAQAQLLQSNLSTEQEAALREMVSAE